MPRSTAVAAAVAPFWTKKTQKTQARNLDMKLLLNGRKTIGNMHFEYKYTDISNGSRE